MTQRPRRSPAGAARPLALVTATWLIFLVPGPAAGQNYRFQVVSMELQAHILPDASVRLEYEIVFRNAPGARPIDVVDVGLPHDNYRLNSMSAAVDGIRQPIIAPSTYIDTGVEVQLAPVIADESTFTFSCVMPDMVYQDTTREDRASFQIRPTWFDPQLQTGSTRLQVAIHFPPGLEEGEVAYQRDDMAYDQLVFVGEGDDRHVVAVWQRPGVNLSARNPTFGVSFSKSVMERVIRISATELLVRWFEERPVVRMVTGVFMLALFCVVFYRFSRGTGWVLLLAGVVLLFVMMLVSPGLQLLLIPVLLTLFLANESLLFRRRKKYLPAMATVEGGGIKRGLTAPQAAVLLELPLQKVLTLVLFGLLKKGLVQVVEQDPLTVEVMEPYKAARRTRRKRAGKNGILILQYEQPFLDRLQTNTGPVSECDFREALAKLIKGAAGRMKGYDLSETREYYRSIVSRAWKEAETIGEVQLRRDAVDRNLEWMMLDSDWNGRMGQWEDDGFHYRPAWVGGRILPGHGSSGAPSSASSPAPTTSFSDVAASFVGWAENTSGNLVGKVEPGDLGIQSGLVDLGFLDTVTSDLFEALEAAQSSGGGGGGGGCACACAGCACACACAGGGR